MPLLLAVAGLLVAAATWCAPPASAASPLTLAQAHAALDAVPWAPVAEPDQDCGIAPPACAGNFTRRPSVRNEAVPCAPRTSRRPAFVPLRN